MISTNSTEMFRRTYADIDIENLLFNWSQIKKIAGDDRFICPMVKANAYGHGDIQVSKVLEKEGARVLGVCLIEEGLLLRAAGVRSDILVFRGFDKRGAEKIFEYQLTPVVSTWEQIQALEAVADTPIKVHLKFDTGMNRIGFDDDQAERLDAYFSTSKKLKLKAVLTHLSNGEDSYLPDGFSSEQIKRFIKICDFFKAHDIYYHVLNSGGIAGLATKKNKILLDCRWGFRPGLMLYGYQAAAHFKDFELKPVMTLKSVVNNIRKIELGETVSYGGAWKAERPSRVAIVPIGYADGVHRLISNKSTALFAQKRVPVIGRICMDFLMLDVTDVVLESEINKWIEEEVVLFGYDEKNNFLSATEMANNAETIIWETLTSIGERVPRHFKGASKGIGQL